MLIVGLWTKPSIIILFFNLCVTKWSSAGILDWGRASNKIEINIPWLPCKYTCFIRVCARPRHNLDTILYHNRHNLDIILYHNLSRFFFFFFFFDLVENETRCYDELGCINITRDWYHLIYRPLNVFPLPRQVIDTRFILYTRKNPNLVNILLYYRRKVYFFLDIIFLLSLINYYGSIAILVVLLLTVHLSVVFSFIPAFILRFSSFIMYLVTLVRA